MLFRSVAAAAYDDAAAAAYRKTRFATRIAQAEKLLELMAAAPVRELEVA